MSNQKMMQFSSQQVTSPFWNGCKLATFRLAALVAHRLEGGGMHRRRCAVGNKWSR